MYYGHMHRAVRRGDAATLSLIEKGFDQISPAEKKALEDKWFGAPLAGGRWLRGFIAGAAVLAIAAVVAVLWGLALRRAVRDKTAEIDSQARRLRTLIDTLPDLVWFKGLDGRFLACNVRFERFIGAPENELIGHPASAFLPAAVAAEFAAADQRALEVRAPVPHQFTLTYAHDGHQELVESLHTPVFGSHGELTGVLSIGRDVTQRRDDERHLRRLNRLYQVLTNVHAAIARERAPEPLFTAICQIMVRDGGLRMAWVGRPDAQTGDLVPVAWAGTTGTYLAPPHASLAAGPARLCPQRAGVPRGACDALHRHRLRSGHGRLARQRAGPRLPLVVGVSAQGHAAARFACSRCTRRRSSSSTLANSRCWIGCRRTSAARSKATS